MRAHAAYYHPNDTYYQQGYLWNLDDPVHGSYYGIDAAHAWAITVGSPAIVGAIVDTGIIAHPDLARPRHPGLRLHHRRREGARRRRPRPDDDRLGHLRVGRRVRRHGHRQRLARLARRGHVRRRGDNGYGIVGVDWRARIQPVRVLGRCGSGSTVDITEGMLWASGGSIPGVPPNPTPARVINLSIGGKGECTAFEQALYDEALSRGALVVVSAGNENDNADLYSPASCYGIATVVATDPYGYRASYSNYSALRGHRRARRRQRRATRPATPCSRRSTAAPTIRPTTTSSTGRTAPAWRPRT